MKDIDYGYTTFKNLDVVGEKVLIKKIVKDDLMLNGGIYVPESEKNKNRKIGVGQIIDLGSEAIEKYGVAKEDYVLYDYYSAFGDWDTYIITNGENILAILNESEANDFLNGELKV